MATSKKCLACGSSVEEGYILDHGDQNRRRPAEWWAGEPEKSFWAGIKKPDRTFKVQALRCTRCGLLMQFANPDETV